MLSRNTSSVTESDVHALGAESARLGGSEVRWVDANVILEVPSARTDTSPVLSDRGENIGQSRVTGNRPVEGGLMLDDSPPAARGAGGGRALDDADFAAASNAATAPSASDEAWGDDAQAASSSFVAERGTAGRAPGSHEQGVFQGPRHTGEPADSVSAQPGEDEDAGPPSHPSKAVSAVCGPTPASARDVEAALGELSEGRNTAPPPAAPPPAAQPAVEASSSRELVFPPL